MTGFKSMMPDEEPVGAYVPSLSDRSQPKKASQILQALGAQQNLGMAAQAMGIISGGSTLPAYTLANASSPAVSYTASSLVNS